MSWSSVDRVVADYKEVALDVRRVLVLRIVLPYTKTSQYIFSGVYLHRGRVHRGRFTLFMAIQTTTTLDFSIVMAVAMQHRCQVSVAVNLEWFCQAM